MARVLEPTPPCREYQGTTVFSLQRSIWVKTITYGEREREGERKGEREEGRDEQMEGRKERCYLFAIHLMGIYLELHIP